MEWRVVSLELKAWADMECVVGVLVIGGDWACWLRSKSMCMYVLVLLFLYLKISMFASVGSPMFVRIEWVIDASSRYIPSPTKVPLSPYIYIHLLHLPFSISIPAKRSPHLLPTPSRPSNPFPSFSVYTTQHAYPRFSFSHPSRQPNQYPHHANPPANHMTIAPVSPVKAGKPADRAPATTATHTNPASFFCARAAIATSPVTMTSVEVALALTEEGVRYKPREGQLILIPVPT